MKLFERIYFPTAAIYNIKSEVKIKIECCAEVEVIKNQVENIEILCTENCCCKSNQKLQQTA